MELKIHFTMLSAGKQESPLGSNAFREIEIQCKNIFELQQGLWLLPIDSGTQWQLCKTCVLWFRYLKTKCNTSLVAMLEVNDLKNVGVIRAYDGKKVMEYRVHYDGNKWVTGHPQSHFINSNFTSIFYFLSRKRIFRVVKNKWVEYCMMLRTSLKEIM